MTVKMTYNFIDKRMNKNQRMLIQRVQCRRIEEDGKIGIIPKERFHSTKPARLSVKNILLMSKSGENSCKRALV